MEIKIGMGANEIMFCTMKGNMKIDQIVNFSSFIFLISTLNKQTISKSELVKKGLYSKCMLKKAVLSNIGIRKAPLQASM